MQQAKNLLAEQGKIPTLRALAAELNVDPMALYHYFANKAALLEAVTVSLLEAIYQPNPEGQWQAEVRQLCHSYLELLSRYPGLLETMLKMSTDGPAQVFIARLEQALTPLALAKVEFEPLRDLLADYLHGVALAMQCNPGGIPVGCVDAPLDLIFRGLTSR
ncbi:TetR/AcrR family transcriptional regulator [Ferrimonas marina]|uniref:TetR/AcrR family transcriptional regulator n=1 Tax=Ferrimonas marina TaxID=299255 RepID=UPI001F2BB87A|nr:TetR/AcrR family transcriptional regulator [Ferrimonas marina]